MDDVELDDAAGAGAEDDVAIIGAAGVGSRRRSEMTLAGSSTVG
jgi:hypothetical protein